MPKRKAMSQESIDMIKKEFENRDMKVREISVEENNDFKEAFGTDHPDFVKEEVPDFFSEDEIEADKMILTDEKKFKEDWKLNVKIEEEKVEKKKILPTRSGKFVYNQVLGLVRPGVVEEAIKRKAIVKKRWNNTDYYCITVEEVLIGRGSDGKPLKNPRKVVQVSEAYRSFIKELNKR